MNRYYYEMTVVNDSGQWNEKIEASVFEDVNPTNDKDAVAGARRIINNFNSTRRKHEEERSLVSIKKVEITYTEIEF